MNQILWCPRQDSNLRSRLRSPVNHAIRSILDGPTRAFYVIVRVSGVPYGPVVRSTRRSTTKIVNGLRFEAFVLGVVGVLDVDRREWELAREAAGGDPAVVDRPGSRSWALAWISPQIVATRGLQGKTMIWWARKRSRPARRPGPQRRRKAL